MNSNCSQMKLQARPFPSERNKERSIYKLLYYINIIILFSVYILINHFRVTMHFLESELFFVRAERGPAGSSVQIHGYLQEGNSLAPKSPFGLEKIDAEALCSRICNRSRVCPVAVYILNFVTICLFGTLSTDLGFVRLK